ncbi:anti-sigma factor domain-containing protein [Dactylosporangium sp. CA-052675]|uniref:anti-sigma factor n=1 Tax=Dactylosporangium sp. CA-052675 TaxID=3239927 RepID=UPI003D8C14C9
MPHLEPERLVLLALGEETVEQHETGHLDACEQCRAEMDSLRNVAGLGRQASRLRALPPPPEHVWQRIRAELAASGRNQPPPAVSLHSDPPPARPEPAAAPDEAAPDEAAPDEAAPDGTGAGEPGRNQPPAAASLAQRPATRPGPSPRRLQTTRARKSSNGPHSDPPTARPEPAAAPGDAKARARGGTGARGRQKAPRWRVTLTVAAAAAVVGGLLAAGGTALWMRGGQTAAGCRTQDARVALQPLPGAPAGAGGYACLRVVDGERRLVVHAEGMPVRDDADYEAWLLDREEPTVRMEALGVLGKESELTVPASLDLSRYDIIDISVEPHDGNAAHSGLSMLRGTLR